MRATTAIGLVAALTLAACGVDDSGDGTTSPSAPVPTTGAVATTPPTSSAPDVTGCADVIAVEIEAGNDGFTVIATVSSADTGWDKYADAWQVRTRDGTVLGERVLAHPHETEQPFTRSLGGVEVPVDIDEVVVAARDSVVGFCGAEFVAAVPHP